MSDTATLPLTARELLDLHAAVRAYRRAAAGTTADGRAGRAGAPGRGSVRPGHHGWTLAAMALVTVAAVLLLARAAGLL